MVKRSDGFNSYDTPTGQENRITVCCDSRLRRYCGQFHDAAK